MPTTELPRKFFPQSNQTYLSYFFHIHHLNRKWWYDADGNLLPRDMDTHFALMASELSEAVEAVRKNKKDDHLPQFDGVVVELADFIIRLADNIIGYKWKVDFDEWDHLWEGEKSTAGKIWMIHKELAYFYDWMNEPEGRPEVSLNSLFQNALLLMLNFTMDPWEIIYQKLIYNYTRADHSYSARAQPDGKKF